MTNTDCCSSSGLMSFDEALVFLLSRACPLAEEETIPVCNALGRISSRSVRSEIDVPGYDNSAMDGYALRCADLKSHGKQTLRIAQRIAAGGRGVMLGAGEAARIFTGAPLPPGADTVVMQEHCRVDGETLYLSGPIEAGAWVRPRGNDIASDSEILTSGTRLRPQEMGLLASVGNARITVRRRLRVAIFSTGDELVSPGDTLPEGSIYNSNRYTLHGLLMGLGCEVLDLGTVKDTFEATKAVLTQAALEADVIVTTGGVSVGEEDHIKRAVESVGCVELWGVAVKPGKPLVYGRIGEADLLGLPGNPVSVLVTFCLFVRPFLLRRQGAEQVLPRSMQVTAGFEWKRGGDRREFVRARLQSVNGRVSRALLFPRQGSDVLTSAAWADGLVEIPEGAVIAPGDPVAYLSFKDLLS